MRSMVAKVLLVTLPVFCVYRTRWGLPVQKAEHTLLCLVGLFVFSGSAQYPPKRLRGNGVEKVKTSMKSRVDFRYV